MEALRSRLLEIGVASRALTGEPESGDRHVVKRFRNGALLAVVDGLGHGAEAAEAAKIAIATLVDRPQDSVITLVRRCHEELLRSRGVVMSVASVNSRDETVSWLSVGNVESILVRADASANPAYESPILRGGVVGSRLPPLRASVVPVAAGDTLILATDGIKSGFARGLHLEAPPQQIADHILVGHIKGTDDALVLVARYRGTRE
ncbi:MAG: SpoIIE family protein phosphatase [Candidatus Dormibacteraceae bacterium]